VERLPENIWAKMASPRLLRRSRAQVYHAQAACITRSPETGCVVTLHDLAILRHPERFRRWHLFGETAAGAPGFGGQNYLRQPVYADEAIVLLDCRVKAGGGL